MKFLVFLILNAAWKLGIIQENIFRNRKIGEDPQSRKWHWWQGWQYLTVVAMLAIWNWRYLFYEFPLTVLFWILFQGFNNTRTFNREWWYVGIPGDKNHGSAIDRWFLRRKNPKKAIQIAQFSALGISILLLVIHYL